MEKNFRTFPRNFGLNPNRQRKIVEPALEEVFGCAADCFRYSQF